MDDILEHLKQSGPSEPAQIAESLGIPEEDVREKIHEYKESGVLQGYKAIINHEELPENEAPMKAFIEITISPQPDSGFESIAGEIIDHPEVTSCYLCSGDYDLLAKVEGDSLRQISDFVARELAPNPNIQGTVSHFQLKSYKEDGVRFDEPTPDHRLSISL
ncbi:MAG: Lrp/AsnC family transcriptional regulator [bacterium]